MTPLVDLEQGEAGARQETLERHAEHGRDLVDATETGGVEARAVAERGADDGVVARRHVLQHPELVREEQHRVAGAPHQARRARRLVRVDEAGCGLDLEAGQFQPQLRRLMDGLEQMLVAVHHLGGSFL